MTEALTAYREIVARAPSFPDAFHFGALAAHTLGKEELARDWLATAERLAPERVNFLVNAARFFDEIGEFQEAETRAKRAWQLAPQDPRTLLCHANLQIKLNRGDALTRELESLAQAYPAEPHIGLLLARSRLQGGRRAEARAAFADASRSAQGAAAVELEFAQFLRDEGELNSARQHYEQASKTGDAHERAIAQRGLASLAAQTGDKEAARRHAERALGANAGMYFAWTILVDASEDAELDALRPRLERIREHAKPPEDYVLDFALGSLYERLGNYPAAWSAWTQGNRLRRQGLGYDPAQAARFFADIRRDVGNDFLARHAAAGNASALPVFIVGMPRSGSTLLERALGGHPAIREGGEMHLLPNLLNRRAGAAARHELPAWLAHCSRAEIGEIAGEWLADIQRAATGAERLTDKLLSNFAWVGLIWACFPNATVIHMRRDPRDVFVSCWSKVFDESVGYCYDVAEFQTHYRNYQAMMRHWQEMDRRQKFIEVDYEALVENLRETVTRVLAAMGLEWHPDCARFASRPGSVHTASWFQVRRPLYASSAGRWRRYREQLGPLADREAWR
jgi:Tfp pilus assembly protein PilF